VTIEQISSYFNGIEDIKNEIRCINYVDQTNILISFIKDAKFYLFDYSKGETIDYFESPLKEEYN